MPLHSYQQKTEQIEKLTTFPEFIKRGEDTEETNISKIEEIRKGIKGVSTDQSTDSVGNAWEPVPRLKKTEP